MKTPNALIDRAFHTFYTKPDEPGKKFIDTQGRVLAQINEDLYLIQHYSFIDGHETNQRLASLKEMTDWKFYDNNDEMNRAYERSPTPLKRLGPLRCLQR